MSHLKNDAPPPGAHDAEDPNATNPSHANATADASAPEQDSILDSLARRLGAIPWWAVSSAFHVVLFALFILMMTEIPKDTTLVRISSLPIEQIQKPIDDKPKPTIETIDRPQLQVELQEVSPDAVVATDPVEVIDHNETPDEANEHDAHGRLDALSNVDYGDIGKVGVIGVGSGSPAGAYGRQTGRGRLRAAIKGNGTRKTENAVELALAWLAKHQEPDGHWDTVKYNAQEAGKVDTAATGLATLAFLGAGYTDKRGTYKDNVARALAWIEKQQAANGCITPGANGKEAGYGPGYHHAICGLALAEAYGMNHNPVTKTAAQQAINYSVNIHQDGQGSDKLGWRYSPHTAGDISVSGWFIMQMKSARLAGIAVPNEGFQGAMAFLDSVEVKGAGNDPYDANKFKYQPARAEASPMQTMIGCTARMFLGWPKDQIEPAIKWAVEKHGVPTWGANGESVDWYYMYYGAMTTFQVGGDVWKQWNEAMKPMLVDHQRMDNDEKGSWDPTGTYANLGRVWSTTNGALCLEVYYRYTSLYRGGANGH